MGQKVNPVGFRLGLNHSWKMRWFDQENYIDLLSSDLLIRKTIFDKYSKSVVSEIIIERPGQKLCVVLVSPRPGAIIGKKGSGIDVMKAKLDKMTGADVMLNIIEVRKPEIDSACVADSIARQLEKRASFRRVVKKAVQSAMKAGAKGIRVICSGRLGGIEIARSEKMSEGSLPLHTLRADINYSQDVAYTSYGTCGVKVWIYLGDINSYDPELYDRRLSAAR